MSKRPRRTTVKVQRSTYHFILENGKRLEVVYRVQTAQNEKPCQAEKCIVGTTILPMQKYARLYFADTDEMETLHYACFREEFKGCRLTGN